ncbi:hypothetical protein PUN28_014923 [Cardiocondyla obscurior]|uniref:Uncharacterized protein n=1 Tax=Cardiocondyla obscurior TaxID=286306 RepID=A0AAW2EXW3_9HYME
MSTFKTQSALVNSLFTSCESRARARLSQLRFHNNTLHNRALVIGVRCGVLSSALTRSPNIITVRREKKKNKRRSPWQSRVTFERGKKKNKKNVAQKTYDKRDVFYKNSLYLAAHDICCFVVTLGGEL